jgi:hypothetical protein
MATLTGLYISQSYGGVIHLSTNTGIVTGSFTQLQDGFGTNLGVLLNGQGAVSASSFTGSLFGTASFATSASYAFSATSASFAPNWTTSSVDIRVNGMTIGKAGGQVATNTAVGFDALKRNVTGAQNTAFGYNALVSASGDENTGIGYNAGGKITTGTQNIAIGDDAMSIGPVTSIGNIAIGNRALESLTSGVYNVLIGVSAGEDIYEGFYNTGVGTDSQAINASGSYNTTLGYRSGAQLASSVGNTLIGTWAGYVMTSGSFNTIVGIGDDTTGVGIGNNNTIIGGRLKNLPGALSNNIILADGSGSIRAQYSGSWVLSGNVSASSFSATTFTGNLTGTASYATQAANSTLFDSRPFSVFANTGSNTFVGNQIITGSLILSSSAAIELTVVGGTSMSGSLNVNGNLDLTGSLFNKPQAIFASSQTASLDFSSGSIFTLDLPSSATNTFITATNLKPGASAALEITQGLAGNATVSFSSAFTFPSGSSYTAFASGSAKDVITLVSFNGSTIRAVAANNFI